MYSVERTRVGAVLQEITDALSAPLNRLGRTLLVFLAYALGAAALSASAIITQSTTGSIVEKLTAAGSSEVTVTDTRTSGSQPWTKDDPQAAQSWHQVELQAAQLRHTEGVHSANQLRTFTTEGNHLQRLSPFIDPAHLSRVRMVSVMTPTDEIIRLGLHPERGQIDLLSSPDISVIALGSDVAKQLGVTDVGAGIEVWLNDRPVSVVAIFHATGDVYDGWSYLSPGCLPVVRDQLQQSIVLTTEPGYAEPVAQVVPLILEPGNPGTINVSVVAQLANLQKGINSDLGSLMSVIGIVVLVLSALTASTTMFLAVNHRYPEIALRRAMGGSRASIARLFLYEGIAIGLAGGIVGTGAGTIIGWYSATTNHWPLNIGWTTVLLGWGIGLLTGIVASIVPAIHAARQDPAGILRAA